MQPHNEEGYFQWPLGADEPGSSPEEAGELAGKPG